MNDDNNAKITNVQSNKKYVKYIISLIICILCTILLLKITTNTIYHYIVAYPLGYSQNKIQPNNEIDISACYARHDFVNMLKNKPDKTEDYDKWFNGVAIVYEAINKTEESFYFAMQVYSPNNVTRAFTVAENSSNALLLTESEFAATNTSKFTKIVMDGEEQPLPIYLKRGAYVFYVDGDKVTGTRVAPWVLKEDETSN